MPWTDAFAAALADRYRLDRELGAGGMAAVYLAQDLRHDRKVAIKVVRPDLSATIGERFLAEIRTTAGLNHPHILPLFDSGSADGLLFFVTPVADGETLKQRIARLGSLPVDEAVRIASEVASALEYAHRRGVIHRDIKPDNILLQDGHALVADFGIALAPTSSDVRLTQTGASIGTPQYMSPEQMLGERELDGRTDIYSLGVVLYEALTGEPPFTAATPQAIAGKVLAERAAPPSKRRRGVPPSVDVAVMTALERQPAHRFATAAALHDALTGQSRPRQIVTRARVAAVAGALIIGSGAYAAIHRSGTTTGSGKRSIAALPFRFESLGGDTSRIAALADNMPQQILDALTTVPSVTVRVMPRDARFRNVTDPRRIAPELDADLILMGDMTLEGDSIRVTIRPYDVALNRMLLPIPFLSSTRNLFALEAAISRGVADKLRLGHEVSQAGTDAKRATATNPAAYEEVIRARWYVESRQCSSLDSAIARYTSATRIDPTYSDAWAGLAQAHNLRAAFWCAPSPEAFAPARDAVATALAVDGTSAVAYMTRGFLHLLGDWNPPAAAEDFRRSIQLDSTRSDTWLYRTWYYAAVNRLDSARQSIRRAKALEPTSSIIRTRVATVLYMSDSLAAARDEIDEVLRHEPRFMPAIVQSISIYADLNQCDRVRAILRTEPELAAQGRGDFGYAEARCGDVVAARQTLAARDRLRASGSYVGAIESAMVYAGLRDSTKMLASLRTALDEHDWQMVHLGTSPAFAPYRSSAAFRSIIRKVEAAKSGR
jgi:serine/threonine-protein kinase